MITVKKPVEYSRNGWFLSPAHAHVAAAAVELARISFCWWVSSGNRQISLSRVAGMFYETHSKWCVALMMDSAAAALCSPKINFSCHFDRTPSVNLSRLEVKSTNFIKSVDYIIGILLEENYICSFHVVILCLFSLSHLFPNRNIFSVSVSLS